MRVHTVTIAVLFVFCPTATALGQPEQVEVRVERLAERSVRVTTRWAASGEVSGSLVVGTTTTSLYDGHGGAATITSGHGTWLVAYAVDAPEDPFRVRTVSPRGMEVGEEIRIARPLRRQAQPFAVVAAATPDGFTVLFQEVAVNDPSAASTYMVLLGTDGRPTGGATEVPVPWSLADMVWNGAGYHLALIFPGNGTGMRLSMVSITPAGQPQQHPDWSSAAGYVTDVHLVRTGNQIRAFYRGGGGDRLLESDVTQIRGWGSEPPRARRHGPIRPGEAIVLDQVGDTVRPGRE